MDSRRQERKRYDAKILAGSAVLAALVVVFDYTLRYSHLKLPFPLYPVLKFDFTGVPIALALYFFGFMPGLFTCAITLSAIVARSGDWVGGFMKALAEASTVVGMAFGLRTFPRLRRGASIVFGILTRCIVMVFANLPISTMIYQMPFEAAAGLSPFIVAFNAVQGSLSALVGLLIFEAICRRVPALTATGKAKEVNKEEPRR